MEKLTEELVNLDKKIKWESHRINGGSSTDILLRIGRLGKNHPRVLIIAGIHGDEQPWSGLAIRKMLSSIKASELVGSLNIIPMANPYATEVDSRVSQIDHLDLNRIFPGDKRGTHSERLAAFIAKEALNDVDIVIDLHGGGSWCVNSFVFTFRGSESLAESFEAPFMVDAVDRANTITGYARNNGAYVTAVEMGGRCDEEDFWADKIARGLIRCLGTTGVINRRSPVNDVSTKVGDILTLRPSRGGVFIPILKSKDVGKVVEKGTVLGHLCDSATFKVLEEFKAPYEWTAILLLRPYITKIEQGAMTFVVAPLYR
jgi:uncharacterized protein